MYYLFIYFLNIERSKINKASAIETPVQDKLIQKQSHVTTRELSKYKHVVWIITEQ